MQDSMLVFCITQKRYHSCTPQSTWIAEIRAIQAPLLRTSQERKSKEDKK